VHLELVTLGTPKPSTVAAAHAERLVWLVRLRWVALGGVLAGAVAAPLFSLERLNRPVLLAAVAVGLLYNSAFALALRRRPGGVRDPFWQVVPEP
jgi:hypothetical protein